MKRIVTNANIVLLNFEKRRQTMKKKIMCTMFFNGLFADLPYWYAAVAKKDEKQNCTKVEEPYMVEETIIYGGYSSFVF